MILCKVDKQERQKKNKNYFKRLMKTFVHIDFWQVCAINKYARRKILLHPYI